MTALAARQARRASRSFYNFFHGRGQMRVGWLGAALRGREVGRAWLRVGHDLLRSTKGGRRPHPHKPALLPFPSVICYFAPFLSTPYKEQSRPLTRPPPTQPPPIATPPGIRHALIPSIHPSTLPPTPPPTPRPHNPRSAQASLTPAPPLRPARPATRALFSLPHN